MYYECYEFILDCPVTWVLCPFTTQAPPTPSPRPTHWGKPTWVPFLYLCLLFFWRGSFWFLSPFSFFSVYFLFLSLSLTFSLFYYIVLYSPKYLLNKPSIPKTFLHGIFVCSLPTTMPHPPWDPPRVTSIINYNNEVQSISFKQLKMGKKSNAKKMGVCF